jgi:hypothetical protein
MVQYPKMYCVWLTKHVSGFCENNVQLYYWSKGTHSPKCKFCGIKDEQMTHISWCKDPGQDSMFKILVCNVHTWLVATLGASTVEEYLLGLGQVTMESCIHGTNKDMAMISKLSDHLGWDSFLEGRISEHWIALVSPYLSQSPLQLLPVAWGWQFISKLNIVIYKQWVYRNLVIHFKSKDRLTVPEHHEILNQNESYSLVNPDILLPCHWFLFEADFEALGCGLTSHQLLWLADMETAIVASNLARAGTLTPLAIVHFSQAMATWVVPLHGDDTGVDE